MRYGLDNIQEYIDEKHKEMCRFIQIEDIRAVGLIEEIAKIPYVDGFIIGPMDLSGSVGELGHSPNAEHTNKLVKEAIEKVSFLRHTDRHIDRDRRSEGNRALDFNGA